MRVIAVCFLNEQQQGGMAGVIADIEARYAGATYPVIDVMRSAIVSSSITPPIITITRSDKPSAPAPCPISPTRPQSSAGRTTALSQITGRRPNSRDTYAVLTNSCRSTLTKSGDKKQPIEADRVVLEWYNDTSIVT
jgi:hypothetical protein